MCYCVQNPIVQNASNTVMIEMCDWYMYMFMYMCYLHIIMTVTCMCVTSTCTCTAHVSRYHGMDMYTYIWMRLVQFENLGRLLGMMR